MNALASENPLKTQLAFPNCTSKSNPLVANRSHITDRKSTRLNSSHSQISYAVFCLKKKKKYKTPRKRARPAIGIPYPHQSETCMSRFLLDLAHLPFRRCVLSPNVT